MSSQVAYGTSTGLVRERNEDSAYVGRFLCAVADGMGGHAAGDVASATVVDAIRQFDVAGDPGQVTANLGQAIRKANDRLAALAGTGPSLAGMGSTLTAVSWSGSHLVVANIGDSRAYRLRAGVLEQLTEDHVMSKLVARPMPPQISGHLVRFLDGRPGWSPDLTRRTACPGDRYMVCSDGLSAVLSADAIRAVLASTSDAGQAVQALMRQTHEAGAPDNVTVIVIDLPCGTWQEREGSPVLLGAAAGTADAV